MAAPLLVGQEEDLPRVGRPAQGGLHVQPGGHAGLDLALEAALAVEDGQLPEGGVVPVPARGHHRQALAVGRVARAGEVPRAGLAQHARAPRAQVHLQELQAVRAGLQRRGVVHEGQAAAVGGEVEVLQAGVGPGQLQRRPLEEVLHAAAGQVQPAQPRHAALGQEAVPVAVLAFGGDIAGGLAGTLLRVAPRLRGRALQARPQPAHEDDAAAIRRPAEGLDAGGEVAHAPRLTAVGLDHVQLRRGVHHTRLAAPRREGQPRAVGRPDGRAVLLAAGGELPRHAARVHRQQPDAGAHGVGGHVGLRDGAGRARAVGRQRQAAQAGQAPQALRVEDAGAGRCAHAEAPVARSISRSRSTRRCTLPVVVMGSASMNSISLGYS